MANISVSRPGRTAGVMKTKKPIAIVSANCLQVVIEPQFKRPPRSIGVHHCNLRGHTEAWNSITPTQGNTPKLGSPSPQREGPNRSLQIHNRSSIGHTEAWESINPTPWATTMCGYPSPNLRDHTIYGEYITPTPGAKLKDASPQLELDGPHRSVGVHEPNSRGHIEVWESITPTLGNTPNLA